jgi:hypothetical protein
MSRPMNLKPASRKGARMEGEGMVIRVRPIGDTQVSHQTRQYFALAEERGAPNATLLRILS